MPFHFIVAPARNRRAKFFIRMAVGAGLTFAALNAAHAGPLEDGAAAFKPHAVDEIAIAVKGAEDLKAKIAANDLAGAKAAWIASRVGWEGAETFTGEFFPDLDSAIDAWPDAKTGYHALEVLLFKDTLAGAAPLADGLLDNLTKFQSQLETTRFTAQGLVNGMTQLAYEVGESKAGGGESPVSGNSLADMQHNVGGIQATYETVLEPALKAKDPALASDAASQIKEMVSLLSVGDIKSLDAAALRKLGENLANTLMAAAPEAGLAKPSLED
jgi:iron uptake system component EfeO